MKEVYELGHNGLALMGWPAGSYLVVDPEARAKPYDVVLFQADGSAPEIGIYRPSPCGRCADFIAGRLVTPEAWEVQGVVCYRLAG